MALGRMRLCPFVLVGFMLFASLSPLMQLEAYAHPSHISEWGSGGYNDTGWLRIDAVGADPNSGQNAEGDLHLELAPGAMIDNLSFEVRVNGSNGTWIEQPQLSFVDTQTSIIDWRGLGGFGQQNDLMGPDPHSSRLAPNAEAGASWLIPGDAEVTDLVVEALRPADTYVTLSPIIVNVNATAIHPTDGRLYMLMGPTLIQLDANNDPPVIEIADDITGAKTMIVDENNDRLLVAVDDNATKFRAWSLSDSNELPGPLALDAVVPSSQFVTAMHVDISGVLWIGTNKADLIAIGPTGNQIPVVLNPFGGSDYVNDIIEVSGDILLATKGGGVMRYDSINSQWLTAWDTQNSLPSDNVVQFSIVNGVLMVAMADAGIVRYNIATSSWLATWTDANWLDSNNVHGMAIGGEWFHILAGDSLHFYNVTMGAFSSSKSLLNVGLARGGMNLVTWPSGGSRAPSVDTILASDGSGSFAQLEPATPPIHSSTLILASGPTSTIMHDVLEINNMVWVAGDEVIDIFDKQHNRWLNPIWTGTMNQALETDGTNVWLATKDAGIIKYAPNGSMITHLLVADGLNSNDADFMAYDISTDSLVVGHSAAGVTLINNANDSVSSSWSTGSSDRFSNNVRDVAARAAIAYIASDRGVLRIDITNDTLLSSWSSTGMDDVLYMPVETDGSLMYLGMYGYGVLVFDRISGDVIDTWRASSGSSGGISNNNVYSLHRDTGGSIWVGTANGADKWDGTSWSHIQAQGGFNPSNFYDLTSDSTYLYAGTNAGACQYRLSDLGRVDCWNYYSSPEGLPSSWVYSVAMLSNGLLYAGTNYGAGVIDVVNDTVVDVWTAGEETWNAPIYEYDDMVYIGLNGAGIARYDRINDTWLPAWDTSNFVSPLNDNDVSTLIPDRQAHRIWVGGDFGLRLIDLINGTLEETFSPANGQNAAGELVIIGNILYWSEDRAGTQSNDNIYRYDIDNMTTLSSIDAGQRIGQSGLVYGIGEGPDGMLWIGVTPSGWQSGLYAGSVVRWDHANDTWGSTLDETGSILRVNSVYAGECAPLNISSCHIFASYGEKVHRHFDYYGNLLNEWDDSVIQGPIRSIDLYQGLIHFATYDGIARYDMYNDTWASTLTPGSGLPSNSEDTIYDIEIVGDDLWYTTMASGGWTRNSRIFQYNGTTQQWTSWSAGSNNIPQGFGFSMEVCNNIMHVAMSRYQGFGNQGGVARYNLSSGQWMSQWTQGSTQQRGLDDDDAIALACDERADVVYVGFEENDVGISRFGYHSNTWLTSISETTNGILPDQVFPDGMRWYDGILMISHTSDGGGVGGISRIAANGGQLGSGIQLDVGTQASSMEIVPSNSNQVEWLIGRPGGDSGYNRVDIVNSTGIHKGAVDILAGLSSGRMLDVTFQGTDVWATFASDSSQYYGSSILHGELLSNGSIVWIDAYSFVWNVVNEMLPVNNDLWVTTYTGLFSVDITTGQISGTPVPLHNQMHGISKHGGDLVVGLMGTPTSSAGFQVYNLTTNIWTDGSLLAGLPSNLVRDFVEYDNRIWIATYSGIGVWNITSQSWDDSITTQNGLSSTFVEQIWVENGELMLATPTGLVRWDVSNETVVATYDRTSGLIGDRVNSIAYSSSVVITSGNSTVTYGPTLFLSHNGQGASRPGATAFDLSTMLATQQYQVDMLPSNDVRSVVGDWWGVHVATTEEPLMHWNAGANQMEAGSPSWAFQSWPIRDLVSDGSTLLAINNGGVDWIDVSGTQHGIYHQESMFSLTGGWVGANGIWLTTLNQGLYGFGPAPNHLEVERESMRRADPLTATFSGTAWDITNYTKPGALISLIDSSTSVITPTHANSASPLGIPIHQMPLTLSSPVNGAAVWLSSHYLNYTGVWNLTAFNSDLDEDFSIAARRGTLAHGGRDLHIRLQSPLNGSLEVRIKYNWSRSESPVEILDLYDRPDDGGGVLIAEWTPSQDHGWAAYRIYLQEGNWSSTPTSVDLATRAPDIRIPVWSVTLAEITTANGAPIIDGADIYGVALIEYDDGTLGEPSPIIGPASSSDEIPQPPEWANGGPADGGADGDLYVEWRKCTAIDHAGTRAWVVEQEINDAVGLTSQGPDINAQANSTVFQLEKGRPYWVALTCVDEAGQHDPANATVIGPIVPTGGINDGIPPAPVENIVAYDTPNDGGGRITVEWTPNSEEDCAWHTILVRPSLDEFTSPTNAIDFANASIIPDCTTNSTIISDWGDIPLVDNTPYWVTVVAFDAWGNGDLGNVTAVLAIPEKNQHGSDPPPRVENLSAWDHPDDMGNAIDVAWKASTVDDFGYYVVWASNQPVDDLALLWSQCQGDVEACGAVKINIQYPIGSEGGVIDFTLTKALYDGDSIEDSQPDTIRPNVPLSVTVTIHDLYDSAFLTNLPTVVVIPIDNRDDIIAPDRLPAPTVTDVPGDNGTAVFVDFEPSDASDISHYEVYADIIAFTSTGHRQPVMILDRAFELPIILENIDGGDIVMSGIPIHVAIIPVDSSGNAHRDSLNIGSGKAIDNSGDDPGGHLPDVDFTARWSEDGAVIEVDWVDMADIDIRSYRIYVSKQRFENTDEADLVKDGIIGTFWSLDKFNGTAFDNSTQWFVAVSAYDGNVWKHLVQAKEVKPYKAPSDGGVGDDNDGEASAGLFDLLDINTLLTIILSMAIFTVLMLAVRARRNRAGSEAWQLAHAAWGLPQQEENWGESEPSQDADLAGTLMPAASQIKAEETSQSSASGYSGFTDTEPPTDASRRLAELSQDLFDEAPTSRPSSGDSELDSLIDDLL
ncbi:MAG: hypothetical protein QF544_05410 [Candidatus Thalassarchaeaceae archaeon]|nr:hypothetical protein [Candidatus Thalassarchaeaceae archaeon]